MGLLLIVRHGQASFGDGDYDVLSPLGHEQAAAAGAHLRAAETPVGRVLSGTLRRQRDTAAAIAAACGLTPSEDAGFNEYDADAVLAHHSSSAKRLEHPGDPAAVPSSARELQATLDGALGRWIAAGADSPAPETWPAFHDRVIAALGAAADDAGSRYGATVAVSSGGSIAALCVALTGGDPGGFLAFNRVAVNCAISRVIIGRHGPSLLSFNEQQHLGAGQLTYR